MNAVLEATKSTATGTRQVKGADGEITFDLVMVPEPGATCAALAAVALLALRRRRRP
jgi:MYXO-CTERM domain-containing protein